MQRLYSLKQTYTIKLHAHLHMIYCNTFKATCYFKFMYLQTATASILNVSSSHSNHWSGNNCLHIVVYYTTFSMTMNIHCNNVIFRKTLLVTCYTILKQIVTLIDRIRCQIIKSLRAIISRTRHSTFMKNMYTLLPASKFFNKEFRN